MKFFALAKKPPVNLELPPLCNFRSGKGYLWALVRDKLTELQDLSSSPLHILDAACHSLITRGMFPDRSKYYGVDISKHRLKSAFSKKRDVDVLLAADLTRPFLKYYHFDAVVSLNTLSHIPLDLHQQCLNNLLNMSNIGSSMFINTQIDRSLGTVAESLLSAYETLSVVYFDSFLSEQDELANQVNIKNVNNKISINELSLPNDASLHRQALFLASNKLDISSPYIEPSSLSTEKISKLSSLPEFTNKVFETDLEFASFLGSANANVLVAPGLLGNPQFVKLLQLYEKHGIQLIPLTSNMSSVIYERPLYILGLEDQFVTDIVAERFVLNLLRTYARVPVHLVHISRRFGLTTKPSLIFQDT